MNNVFDIYCILQKRDENSILQEVQDTNIRDTNTNLHAHSISSSDEDSSNEEAIGSLIFRKLQRPSVKDILKKTAQGRAIIKSYEKQKVLSKKCRSVIVDLILSEVLNNIRG